MTHNTDARYRHLTTALRVLVLLSLVLQLGLVLRPSEDFLKRPLVEDAYYSLSVARSVAAGEGFSVDGVTPTNGVQPLICVLYAPVFLVAPDDPVAPLRGVVLLDILIGLVGGVLFAGLLVTMRSADELPANLVWWAGLAGYIVNYSLTTHLLNGLETGLALALLLALILYFNRIGSASEGTTPPVRTAITMGLLLGLAILARIDATIVALSAGFLFLYYRLRRSGSIRPADILWVAILGLVALAVSSPWWIYNVTEFGHPLPVSGQSQADLASNRWSVIAASISVLFDAMLPGVHTPTGWTVRGIFLTGLILPALLFLSWLLVPSFRTKVSAILSEWRRVWDWSRAGLLFLSSGMLGVAYTFFFAAPHFQPRYLVTLRVIGAMVFVTLMLTWLLKASRATGWGQHLPSVVMIVILSLSLPLMARHYIGVYSNILLEPVAWIEENTDSAERVGMFQSGTAAYFFPDRVVNLDGKVNVAAHRHFRDGTLGHYVDSMEFSYLIDWPLYTDRVFVDSPGRVEYHPVDTLALSGMVVWKRNEEQPGSN